MATHRTDPFLWFHLAALAAVPLGLEGCLVGLAVQEIVSEVTISQEVHAQTRQEQRTISPVSAGVRPPQTISVPRPPRFQQGGPRSVSPEPEYEQEIASNYPSPLQEVLPDAPALRRVLTNSTAATTEVASVTPPRRTSNRRSPGAMVQEHPANYPRPRQESSTRRTRSTRQSGRRNTTTTTTSTTTTTTSESAPPPAVSARQTELVTNMLRDNPEVEQWMDQVAEVMAAYAPDINFANERDHLTALLTRQATKIQEATTSRSRRRRQQGEEHDHSIVSPSHDSQAPAVVQVEESAEEEEEDLASMDSDLMYDWQDAVGGRLATLY